MKQLALYMSHSRCRQIEKTRITRKCNTTGFSADRTLALLTAARLCAITPFSSVGFRVGATVFLKFLENLPSLAVGHESGEYLAKQVFFRGRLVREEDQLLKLHPAMNGF
jgi:hypothetical protein